MFRPVADALAVLQKLHADSAFVVGALLRPPSASERARSASARAAVRAATADVQAEALVEREAKFHINSTLQAQGGYAHAMRRSAAWSLSTSASWRLRCHRIRHVTVFGRRECCGCLRM